jgi:two-component system chemotaxis response regulator CheY
MALPFFLSPVFGPAAPLCILCEPSPALCAAMERMIRDLGLQVQAFSDADAFRHACTQKPPALVIAQADTLEGGRVSREANPQQDRPVVLVTTASGAAAEIIRGFAAGADEYIVKPFDSSLLRAKLECFGLVPTPVSYTHLTLPTKA